MRELCSYANFEARSTFTDRWLLENRRKNNYDVTIKNVTDDVACLGVAGPHSRDVLSKVTSSDMDDDNFPYMAFRNIEVARLPVQASRFSFTGKLELLRAMNLSRNQERAEHGPHALFTCTHCEPIFLSRLTFKKYTK